MECVVAVGQRPRLGLFGVFRTRDHSMSRQAVAIAATVVKVVYALNDEPLQA